MFRKFFSPEVSRETIDMTSRHQILSGITGSLKNVGLSFKRQKDASVKVKKRTHLLIESKLWTVFYLPKKSRPGRPVPGRTLIKFAYLGNGNELGSGNFFSSGLIYFRPFMRHKGCISNYWFAIFIQFLSWCCHCRKQTELLKNKSRLKIEH